MPCASRRKVPGCVPDVRIEVSRAAWSKHWRHCVWLTCPIPTRAMLASRCSKNDCAKTAEMWGGRPCEKYILWFVIVRASTIWNLMARHISRWSVRASERLNLLARWSEECQGRKHKPGLNGGNSYEPSTSYKSRKGCGRRYWLICKAFWI